MSLEIAAAERRKAIARNERLNDEVDCVDFDGVLWEGEFYRTIEDAFDSKLAAYSRLQDLQGVGIPRCYASGISLSTRSVPDPRHRVYPW